MTEIRRVKIRKRQRAKKRDTESEGKNEQLKWNENEKRIYGIDV